MRGASGRAPGLFGAAAGLRAGTAPCTTRPAPPWPIWSCCNRRPWKWPSRIAAAADPAEQKRLSARYDHLQHELHRQDAYNIDHRIEPGAGRPALSAAKSFRQPVASLSGGEQNRLMLAKLLLAEPNVMILDEPSNHLDIEATEWLEGFLLESSAAMIVVSHDRYFPRQSDQPDAGIVRRHGGRLRGQLFGLLAAEGRAAAGPAAHLREAADRDREDQGLHPPQRLRPEARPGRRPPEEAGADRAGGAVRGRLPRRRCGFRRRPRSGDIVVRAEGAGQGVRSPAVPRRFARHHARPALGPAGTQRLRQDDALAAACWASLPPDEGQIQLGSGRDGRIFRSATGRTGGRRWPWSTPCGRTTSR